MYLPESDYYLHTITKNGKTKAYFPKSEPDNKLFSRHTMLHWRIRDNQLLCNSVAEPAVFGSIFLSAAIYLLQWPTSMYALSVGLPAVLFGGIYADLYIASSELTRVDQMIDEQIECKKLD